MDGSSISLMAASGLDSPFLQPSMPPRLKTSFPSSHISAMVHPAPKTSMASVTSPSLRPVTPVAVAAARFLSALVPAAKKRSGAM